MTQDEIIRMAREAGLPTLTEYGYESLKRFAALVATYERKKCEQEMSLMEEHCAELILIEREACAKVCEQEFSNHGWAQAGIAAAAIRARGEK